MRRFVSLTTVLLIFVLAACSRTDQARHSIPTTASETATSAPATAPATARPTSRPSVVPTATARSSTSRPSPSATIDAEPNWRLLTSTVKNARGIAISPSDPNVVYAVGGGIYKSADGGKTWKLVRSDVDGRDVALGDGGRIVIVASGTNCARGGPAPVYRSTDWGASWQQIQAEALGGLVVDPRNPARFYAATCGGFVRSDDGGQTWRRLPNPISGYDGSAIAVGPDSTVIVGALVSEGGTVRLIRSSDSGASFSPLPAPEIWGSASVAIGDGGRIDVVTNQHAITTSDGGKTWTIVDDGLDPFVKNDGFRYFDVGMMRPNPVTSSILYLATRDGLYRHAPDSGTWKRFGTGLSERVTAFDVAVGGRSTIFYAATAGGIYRLDVSS